MVKSWRIVNQSSSEGPPVRLWPLALHTHRPSVLGEGGGGGALEMQPLWPSCPSPGCNGDQWSRVRICFLRSPFFSNVVNGLRTPSFDSAPRN